MFEGTLLLSDFEGIVVLVNYTLVVHSPLQTIPTNRTFRDPCLSPPYFHFTATIGRPCLVMIG